MDQTNIDRQPDVQNEPQLIDGGKCFAPACIIANPMICHAQRGVAPAEDAALPRMLRAHEPGIESFDLWLKDTADLERRV